MFYLLIIFLSSVFSRLSIDSYVAGSLSYINSRGLNLTTQGFNGTYGTDFGSLHYRFGAFAGLKLNYKDISVGGEFSYLSRISTSESSSYSFAEKISYSDLGASIVFEYRVLEFAGFKIAPLVKFGVSLNLLKLAAEPMPTGSAPEKMSVFNYYGDIGLNVYYTIVSGVSVFTQIAGRLSTSPAFSYYDSTSTGTVTLGSGQEVTINTSGYYVLLGVMFNIWR